MKRLIILIIIMLSFTSLCQAQRKNRNEQSKTIQLPQPITSGSVSIEKALADRRSIRQFTDQTLNFIQIGQLAWAAQGITEPNMGFRTAPSAGAIYPMQIYFATSQGLFFYDPLGHNLQQTINKDIRGELYKAASEQTAITQAPCSIIITGSIQKLAAKYDRKARQYALMEAGHIAQNILLQSVSLKLGAVPIGAFEPRSIRRACRINIDLEPFYIIPVGYPAEQQTILTDQEKETVKMDVPKTKKAVLIIASNNFRDEELFETQKALKDAQIKTTIASSKLGTIRGMLKGKTKSEIFLNEVNVNDYDAVIFIGGSGAKEYFNNNTALDIARQAKNKGKILAAICIAPTILANAGLLDGVKATSFETERVKLKKAGADFTSADVEKDGLIITGSGPAAATEFGQTIVEALQKN